MTPAGWPERPSWGFALVTIGIFVLFLVAVWLYSVWSLPPSS